MSSLQKTTSNQVTSNQAAANDAMSANMSIFALTLCGLTAAVLLTAFVHPLFGALTFMLTFVTVIAIAWSSPTPPVTEDPPLSWEILEYQLNEMMEYPSTLGDKQNMIAVVRRVAHSGQAVKNPKALHNLQVLMDIAPEYIRSDLRLGSRNRADASARNALSQAYGYVLARNEKPKEAEEGPLAN